MFRLSTRETDAVWLTPSDITENRTARRLAQLPCHYAFALATYLLSGRRRHCTAVRRSSPGGILRITGDVSVHRVSQLHYPRADWSVSARAGHADWERFARRLLRS